MQEAQAALDAWVTDYNTARPHQALDMATPAERFRLAPLVKGRVSVPVDSREDHRVASICTLASILFYPFPPPAFRLATFKAVGPNRPHLLREVGEP